MPPRQKTTFDKKGKGTTTYRDYNPAQERANAQLERFIRDNPEGDRRNTEASPIQDVVRDMPAKFQDNFEGITKYEDMNQAQKALFGFYDNRNKYARDMNNLRTSSPEMRQAYAKRFPISNFMMETAPRFIPGIGGLFTADRGMKANAEKERIMNTPVNKPDGGFKNFVDFFAKGMTPDQAKNTEIISGESLRLAPQDIFNKSEPMTEKQKMDFMPGGPEIDIFDEEKAAIDEALPTGDIVYNPADDDFRSKVNFINQALDGANYPYESPNDPAYRPMIEQLFEKVKRNIGTKEIRPTVDAGNAQEGDGEDPIPGGQFDLTNPAFSDQTNLVLSGDPEYDFSNFNTNAELGSLSQDPNSFPEGGVSGTPVTQVGQQLFFADGTPVTEPVDTGLNTPAGQAAIDILNSNATNDVERSFVDDNYGRTNPDIFMNDQKFDTIDYGFADGGSTNKYENMSTHEKLMRMAAEMYG